MPVATHVLPSTAELKVVDRAIVGGRIVDLDAVKIERQLFIFLRDGVLEQNSPA